MFHKKCTNRAGARGGNWREPWLCPPCTTSEIQSHHQSSPAPPSINGPHPQWPYLPPTAQPQAPTAQHQPTPDPSLPTAAQASVTVAQRPSLLQEDDSIVDITPPSAEAPEVSQQTWNLSAIEFFPNIPPAVPIPTSNSSSQPSRRFPNNSIRQSTRMLVP